MCAPDPILNPVTRTLWSDQCLDAVACEGSMIRPTWMPCIVCACKGCIATWYRRYCSSSCITWIDIKQTGNFKEKSKNSKFQKTLGVPTEAGRKVPFSRQPLRNCLIFFCVFFVRKDSVPSLLLVEETAAAHNSLPIFTTLHPARFIFFCTLGLGFCFAAIHDLIVFWLD